MNKELALRTLAYLKTHYNNNNETTICKEDIDAIDFILEDNEKLTDLINKYEDIGYDVAQERADFLLEIERLNNIINEALGIANERVNHYSHINKKEILEDWENIFDVLVERDNQELKGSNSNE